MHVAVSILLLSTLTSAQMRGDNSFAQDICNPNDGDDDVCSDKKPDMDRELDQMEQDLEDLANLTRGAQDKVVYLKDSKTQAQKQAPGSAIYHYLWIEKFFNAKCVQSQLQSILQANEKRIIDLKQMSVQLDQICKEPCKDTVEIQTVTGKDCQDIANKGGKVSGLYYVKPARAPEAFLVYCEIDSFGHGWTVLQRVQYYCFIFHSVTYLFTIFISEVEINNAYSMLTTPLGPEVDSYRLTYSYYFGGDAGDAFDAINLPNCLSYSGSQHGRDAGASPSLLVHR
uniref:Fibrinogen gamma chain n=1 Tax=Cyprinus carpio TaxID=7962 RepID=A0A8C2PW19_CYPCA